MLQNLAHIAKIARRHSCCIDTDAPGHIALDAVVGTQGVSFVMATHSLKEVLVLVGYGPTLTAGQSVTAMMKLIMALTQTQTGKYLLYDGSELPW